ncbi:MAG: DMT family transporter [Anaerolineales bacterium]
MAELHSTVAVAATPKRRWQHWLVLLVGILATSTGSILTRLASAPPLAVGAWRLSLATLLLTPVALGPFRREWRLLAARERWLVAGAGACLSLHFAFWISSLSYTSVASSVVLVSTNPLWVALILRLRGERIAPRSLVAIAIALAGTVVIGAGDLTLSPQTLLGDALAVLGAVASSAYFLLGRAVRVKLSTLAYVWPCYALAAVLLCGYALLAGQPLGGYDLATYGWFALLALGPQILGHSSYNWALGYFSPILVTLALLGEPVGASLLAYLVLGEAPTLGVWLGGPLILAGIVLAAWQERRT